MNANQTVLQSSHYWKDAIFTLIKYLVICTEQKDNHLKSNVIVSSVGIIVSIFAEEDTYILSLLIIFFSKLSFS